MAQKAKITLFERKKNGKRSRVLTIHGEGRTKKLAVASARRRLRSHVKNVKEGFYNSTGFHPIRTASDYDATKLKHGEEGRRARAAQRKARAARRKAKRGR